MRWVVYVRILFNYRYQSDDKGQKGDNICHNMMLFMSGEL
jgi:hypothetical protein